MKSRIGYSPRIMHIAREQMLRLPRPTSAQLRAFEEFLPGAHSWYKASLLSGTIFVVFLNPNAGGDWSAENPLGGTRWKTTENYRRLFGYLDFLWSFGSGFTGEGKNEAIQLPPDLLQRCSFTLFPWGAEDGAGLEVICGGYHEAVYGDWTKLESEAEHDAKQRLFLLRRTYRDAEDLWNRLSDEEREIACGSGSEIDDRVQSNLRLRTWFERDNACWQIYGELRNQETVKVHTALQELQTKKRGHY